MADVSLSIGATVKELEAVFAGVPDIGAKEARKLARSVAKEFKAGAREAEKLRNAMASAGDRRIREALEGAKHAAEGLGGAFGSAGSAVEKAVQATAKLGGALGPVGVALVGTAAGLTAGAAATAMLVRGFVDLERSAEAAIESLGPAAHLLPDDQVARIRDANDALDRLVIVTQQASVALASEFAPAVTDAANLLVRLYGATQDSGYTIGWLAGTVETAARGAFPKLGVALDTVRAGMYALDQATQDYGDTTADQIWMAEQWEQHERDVADALRETRAAHSEAGNAAAEVNEFLRLENAVLADAKRLNEEFAASLDKTAASTTEVTVATQELVDTSGLWAALDQTMAAAEQRVSALRNGVTDMGLSFLSLGTTLGQIAEQEAAADVASTKRQLSKLRGIDNLTAAQQREKEALEDQLKAEKKAARAAWRGRKQLERASAIAGGAAATMRMTAYLAPLIGPAAVGVALGTVGPELAAQLATIAAEPPPTFALGGRVGDRAGEYPDHVPVMASRDEGILTPAAMQRIGGSVGLDALNRGSGMGGDVTVILPDNVVVRSVRRELQGTAGRRMVTAHTGIAYGQARIYGGR